MNKKFKVGQIWGNRGTVDGNPDPWRIEAITDHPKSPVIARAVNYDSILAFGLDGIEGGDDDESVLDLVTLIKDV